jgi:probable HAF family extracellular repeat protein
VTEPNRARNRILVGLFAAAAALGALPRAGAQSYTATALGSLGGGTSFATGINDSGTVTGYTTLASTATHAFRYSGGVMTDLGTLGGSDSHADGLNNQGFVVGTALVNGIMTLPTYAFIYSGVAMSSLGSLGGDNSEAYAINNSGVAVGFSLLADDVTFHAFSYSNGTMTDLGTLGGPASKAYGINSAGTIVGRADFGSGSTQHHGFSYSNGVMTDLGGISGGVSSNAYSINDSGAIVGDAKTSGGVFQAASFANGTVTGLGSVGGPTTVSRATQINNSGTIVGFTQLTTSATPEDGFIIINNGAMTDINSLTITGLPGGVTLDTPAINNKGQMVANGSNSMAYLLTPVAGAATHLVVTAPASADSGVPTTVTVTAFDANNDEATGYTGTVAITSSDPYAELPANATLTSGSGTFSVDFNSGGSETVTATDTVTGSITGVSGTISVTLVPTPTPTPTPTPPPPARLVNLSARANVGTGGNVLIAGFVIGGSGTKSVLLRGVGPGLAAAPFNIPGTLALPQLTLVNPSTGAIIVSATAWGGSSALSAAFASVAAFPLATGSADAALVETLPVGPYTSTVAGVNSTGGLALAEIYDTDLADSASSLVDISARANVGAGANVLIAGFVLEGALPGKVLLRGIGPTLGQAPFNLSGFLAQPQILLYNSSGVELGGSQGWGGSATLAATFAQVGAFPLAASSADAAMVTIIPPGSYTVQLSGQNGTTGIGLLEVYLVPQ